MVTLMSSPVTPSDAKLLVILVVLKCLKIIYFLSVYLLFLKLLVYLGKVQEQGPRVAHC